MERNEPEYSFDRLNDLIVYGVCAVILSGVLTLLYHVPCLLFLPVVAFFAGFYVWEKSITDEHRKNKNRAVRAMMKEYEIEADPGQFVIRHRDRERNTSRERAYRKQYKLMLLEEFGNRCCRCGARRNGLDLDHFFLPKDDGGTFALWHENGFWVNNAIPLCQTCNRSKSDRPYDSYFDRDELVRIMEVNQRMTERLNNDQFMGRGAPDMGGIDPSEVEVTGEVMDEPDTSFPAYLSEVWGVAVDWFEAVETAGNLLHSYVVKPSLVWWLELKIHQKIVLTLTVGCILFVVSLFVFGV